MRHLYPISLFFHANAQYAEIPRARLPDVVRKSYMPLLEVLFRHPDVHATLELSGYTLRYLNRYFPKVIHDIRTLMEMGVVEVIGSTMYNPILGKIRDDYVRLHIGHYLQLHKQLFGVMPVGFYPQEYCLDERIPDHLMEVGIRWTLVWGTHVVRHHPHIQSLHDPKHKAEAITAYLEGEFLHPVQIHGKKGGVVAGLPFCGHEIDTMLGAAAGKMTVQEYVARLVAIEEKYNGDGKGFFLPGLADWEFINSLFAHRHSPVSPEWIDALFSTLKASDRFTFVSPTVHMEQHPPKISITPTFGGGFESFALWEKGSETLDDWCAKAMHMIDRGHQQLETHSVLHEKTQSKRAALGRAQELLMIAQNSDFRGWHPIPEKRKEGIALAQRAFTLAKKVVDTY